MMPSARAGAGRELLARLGPGLVTGASDDDPSGIATYSQVGAQFGLSMLWTMFFSLPLMIAIQEICARLGRITGVGIAESLTRHYPRPLALALTSLLCLANVFNLGADICAMAATTRLVAGGFASVYAVLFGVLSVALQVYVPYRIYVRYLKWLTLVLFAYVAAAFVVHVPWKEALRATLMPRLSLNPDYFMALVAVLGTTISPYLFFWQTSQEAEDLKVHETESSLRRRPSQALAQFRRISVDTRVGMAFSNVVAFFIILVTGVTLHTAGGNAGIHTAADAARALQPLAGPLAFFLFAIGIIGTGMLAVPVLAGAAAYAIAETFRWPASLESKPQQAPQFYGVLALSVGIGVSLNFVGLDPIRALFWSAVLNGIVAVPLMYVLMRMSANRVIVGQFTLPLYLRLFGWAATAIMFVVSLVFLLSALHLRN